MTRKPFRAAAALLLSAALCAAFPASAFAGVVSGAHKSTASSSESAMPGGPVADTAAGNTESGSYGIEGAVIGTSTSVTETSGAVTETQAAAASSAETQAAETAPSTGTVSAAAGPEIGAAAQEIGTSGTVSAESAGTQTQTQAQNYTQQSSNFGTSSRGAFGLPKAIPFNGTSGDLGQIVAGAGLNALGTGNTPPDDILGQVQIATYKMMDANGNAINYTATNDPGNGLYNPGGFSKFYMIHAGVARFYYRTYTDAHGWSPWCTSKETTPYNDDGAKVQAIQIRIKGYVHTFNDVYYKVVLNDGTVLDWAKNGQTTGTMGTDRYIVAIRVGLWHNTESFPFPTTNLMAGCQAYDGAYTDSTGVHYSSYIGQPYTGWAFIDQKQHYFINGEPAQGWNYIDGYKYYLNTDGSVVTDLEPVMGLQSSYQINYNKATRTFYVMAADGNNGYIIPYKTFNSTCGPDTPLGDFNTYAKYDVKYMHDDVPAAIYCKYLSRFYNGFIIHSILFYGTKLELDAITYNYIDDAASGGCIRLLTGDSYWVYKNCPMGTRVHIYYDQWNKGPVEKGACDQCIPRSQTWDPTDPSSAEAVAALQAAAAAEAERAAAVASGSAALSAEDAELAAALSASAQ